MHASCLQAILEKKNRTIGQHPIYIKNKSGDFFKPVLDVQILKFWNFEIGKFAYSCYFITGFKLFQNWHILGSSEISKFPNLEISKSTFGCLSIHTPMRSVSFRGALRCFVHACPGNWGFGVPIPGGR